MGSYNKITLKILNYRIDSTLTHLPHTQNILFLSTDGKYSSLRTTTQNPITNNSKISKISIPPIFT